MISVQKTFPWNNPVQFKSFAPGGNNLPIRDLIFSLERLEQHAQELAGSQTLLTDPRRGRGLSRRVRENARVLTEAYRSIVEAIRLERPITPAAEWLVDNFFVVDEQLREIVKDLPSGFYKKLPKLQNGKLERYPRIFGLAWEFVAHTDSHFDLDVLTRFIGAYQQTTTLEIGELWALPITLRIVMLENLRRVSERVVAARAWREEADAFSDELLGLNGRLAQPLWLMFKRLERRELPRPFVVQLIQRMRDKGETAYQMIRLLEPRLADLGTTSDQTVHEEYQSQTASSVTVRNIITSMRLISNIDWADFFESVSLVDTVLQQSPVFAASDFATRDRYRHAVEELARGCDYSEVRVAEHALQLASAFAPSQDALKNEQAEPKRFKDPGYYLISGGRHLLERALKYKLPISTWWLRTYMPATMFWYVSTIAGISALLLAIGFLALQPEVGLLERVLLGLLLLIPASDLGIALVNSYVTASLAPRTLPKLELKAGVPVPLRTVVAVPTLFTSPAQILEEFEQLEVRYLSNSDGEVYFALLSDFTDAKQQVMPNDEGLLEVAVQAVNDLNARYQPPLEVGVADSGSPRFFLFHRERRWSETEQVFMGWERKRGKLHEFNRLLRGATDTSFIPLETPKLPDEVRFVITLDADTRLPRGSVKRLVGAMAHPLNRPRFDAATNRVVEGYAVLQPRITLSLPVEREGTLFQQVFSSHAGMDPYASAVSDVYQDLFGEGSFAGKGIYDVDAFERAMQGRVPESTLLSHDLFEGLFARAGLLSDVELVEEYPSHYGVHAARQHRWVRGDWQLLPWILSPKAPIMLLGRWKLLDNLRRSLSPIAFLSLLVAGWLAPGINAGVWTGFLLTVFAFPALMPFLTALRPPNWGVSRRSYLLSLREKLSLSLLQLALNLTLLADQAYLMLDAIFRTLWRLLVSHRRLLEWRTAAQAKSGATLELSGFYRAMIAAPVLAILIEMLILGLRPSVWAYALPFLVVWAVSPIVAYMASLPRTKTELDQLPAADQVFLRDVARRTWRYFERFVGPDDHYLAPDNFQQDPQAKIAHRTSPTNVGLALLSTISAHDFGWIGRFETIERLELSFDSIERLELFRGHLFNWYDTQSLQPLEPRYVSTVDSGNLAGHLVALSQSCFELTSQPLLGVWIFEGLRDALRQARAAAIQLEKNLPSFTAKPTLEVLVQLEETMSDLPSDISQWAVKLEVLDSLISGLLTSFETQFVASDQAQISELLYWTRAVQASVRSQRRDLSILMPWANQTFIDSGLSGLSLQSLLERQDLIRQELIALPNSSNLLELFNRGVQQTTQLMARFEKLAQRSEALFAQMDFKFLFDDVKKLFSIGFDVSNHRLDPSFYDLLASEARLTSFIAIAKDEVPTSHWFHLGRELTPISRGTALVSWTGSMFEYLMPRLVMHAPKGSLLEETCDLVVRGQIAYGARRSGPFQTVPWGVSESAFAARDLALNYQYSAFGVPGLGLKRGLGDDLVIAPYASALAAMVDPVASSKNLRQLEAMGASGTYGFYDALDFTASRIPEGRRFLAVQNFMAHHSGMTLVALGNVLLDDRMVKRFHADLRVQSAELLLQERTPRDATVDRPRSEAVSISLPSSLDPSLPGERSFRSIRDSTGQTHLLSNGRYTVMLTVAGAGFSRWNDLAVTRWREDATKDPDGSYIFVRALPEVSRSGTESEDEARVFSATPQPFGLEPEHFEARFFEDRAEFLRRDGVFESKLEVIVSPEDDAELRRLTITNHDSRARTLEITSYSEVVLTQTATDDAHPAFAKLFVQTEFVPGIGVLLATRRPRSPEEPRVWAAHMAALEEVRLENGKLDVTEMDLHSINPPQFETDRACFLGRGRDIRQAQAILREGQLSKSVGAVLDPIFSLRHAVRLQPGATARITFNTLISNTREAVLEMADRYRDQKSFERGLALAWTRAQVELHFLGIAPDETHTFQRLASNALYLNKSLRASNEVLLQNTLPQSGLWRHGISGDLPIVLVRIDDAADLEIVRQLLRAHEYWRAKRVKIDLVILNEQATSYMQELQDAILGLVRSSQMTARSEYAANGSVYTLRADLLSSTEHIQLRSVARAVLLSHQGSLSDQVVRTPTPAPLVASPRSLIPRTVSSAFSNLGQRFSRRPVGLPRSNLVRRPDLEFFNGFGGFSKDGLEYVIVLHEDLWTPAPWINVVANPNIGFTVSELGAGYTWTQNSRENKLTPWSNDPVSDPVGEVIYIRDEETFEVFSATPLPTRELTETYTVRHSQGYSSFENQTHGLHLELTQFVPIDDPVKLSRLIIENTSGKPRKLSVTAYLEWVLGVRREASAPYIITEQDAQTKALFARNPWSEEFANRTAFADLMVQWQNGKTIRFTCDRTEFMGRHGSLENPAALQPGGKLSGRAGAGFDPCAALQTNIDLGIGERIEVVFMLGETQTREVAIALIEQYRRSDIGAVLELVKRHWQHTLELVQVNTPDHAMNLMLNRWLPYQTLSSRIYARTGFYQAGGAFGFRDQLQDTMALAGIKPDLARAQILRAASRQFLEGDVQHWWHPPSGRGVRTRISDDLIWLPYAITHYLEVTGDTSILDQTANFIEGERLLPGHEDSYFNPAVSGLQATVFEHAARALDYSLSVGVHGLPLIGSGDWNDGMNRIGREGKGESVWLAWFLHTNLQTWAQLAETRNETDRARVWRDHAFKLKTSLEAEAWDGAWYKRAFYDDGTPLGSSSNTECQIDSIAQSWAVISGAGDPTRAASAMQAVNQHLVKTEPGMILLFDPPFENTEHDPGYIKGYLPGVRENGGQYTHAAVWSVIAFAMLKNGNKAFELFSMLNPINHSHTKTEVERYKVEPYVLAADVYGTPPNLGRGGWTWYTGSSGWMYRAGLESILGLLRRGNTVTIQPCIPETWSDYQINIMFGSARFEINIQNPQHVSTGVKSLELDGNPQPESSFALTDDGLTHQVRVVLGS